MKKLNIGILIFSKPPKSGIHANSDRLVEAAEQLGHNPIRIYEPLCSITSDGELLHENEPLPDIDVFVSRPNFIEEPSLHTYILDSLLEKGYRVVNGGRGFLIAKNKIEQHILFRKLGLATPDWGIASNPDQALEIASKIGFPVVLKVSFGTHGKGVFFCKDPESFSPLAEYLALRDKNPLIVERYVGEADRKDVRVLIINGEVVAAMERQAPVGDIRANTTTGGTGHITELSREEVYLALKATEAANLEIAGVDIIRSKEGPQILEINANPGFVELERVTQVDVAKAIIEYTVSQAKTS